eukprot:3121106-Ditylum_brightwellii.AAC.1
MTAMEALEAWEIIDQVDAPYTAKGVRQTIIESTWAFKKSKAHLCVRGDQHVEGIDYFETYAPEVSWSTVRTVMTLAVNLGLKSQQ